jgi:CheY-like chemotaxis protein
MVTVGDPVGVGVVNHRGHLLCTEREEKNARAAGCDDYVPKPYSPRQLLAKIRQYLS